MPDQPNQQDRKLAEWFSKRKEDHLANFPGLENVTSAEAFKEFQEKRRQSGMRVPTEIVWKDIQEANTYAETPKNLSPLLETHDEVKKEKREEKHDQHVLLSQRQQVAPAGIDEDPRYRAFLKQAHETWNRERPNQAFNEETILTDKDGHTRVNPRLRTAVPTAHATALGMFREKHGEEEIHHYEALEKKRIYKYHNEDPAVISMRKRANEIAAKAFWSKEEREKLGITGIGLDRPNREEIVQAANLSVAIELGQEHSEKLAAYAQRDSALATAHETLANVDKELLTKEFPSQLVKEETRKRLIRQKIQQAVANILPGNTLEKEETITTEEVTPPQEIQPPTSQTITQTIRRQILPQQRGDKYTSPDDESAEADSGSGGQGGGLRTRRPSRRQLQMGGQGLKQLGGFGNRAVMLVIQAQNAIPPHVKLAILLILIVLALFLLLLMSDNPPPEEGAIPINITKSMDDKYKEILNPALPVLLDTTPVESDIVYTINVSYAGSATDIIVTDPIPEGSILVSTDPKAKQLDGSGNPTDDIIAVKRVEWSVKDIQLGVGAPDSPRVFSPQTLTLIVRPNTNNDYIVNQATAQAIGITDGGSGGIPNTGQCADPPDGIWPDVNRWDSQILLAIATIEPIENKAVPCNLVKAFIHLESQGQELPPNGDLYRGLMQVGPPEATGGGSNCDLASFDINTTQGNLNCGVQVIARELKACPTLDQAIGKYFTGTCEYWTRGPDDFGTTPQVYVDAIKSRFDYLNGFTGP